MDINELYYTPYIAYKGSSYDVLRQLAEYCKLGFATNIDSTDDLMTWINPGEKIQTYINDITQHSYKNDGTFLWSYIDFYYNLTYLDLEKQLKDDTSKLSEASTSKQLTDKEQVLPLKLTNHPDSNATDMFIKQYNLDNSSTKSNLDIGYKARLRYYDMTENDMTSILLDTLSDAGKKGDQVVMKAQPDDMTGLLTNSLTTLYGGKQDQDNVHKNFLYAYKQNSQNLQFLQKIKMTIVMGQPNYNLYRFELVPIEIYEMSDIHRTNSDTTMTNNSDGTTSISKTNKLDASNPKKTEQNQINKKLSGDWLITGIVYTMKKGDESVQQEITLTKREISADYTKSDADLTQNNDNVSSANSLTPIKPKQSNVQTNVTPKTNSADATKYIQKQNL